MASSPLKEARFLRKVAKRLGLHVGATAPRVIEEIRRLIADNDREQAANATPTDHVARLAAAADLEALLDQVAALRPVRQALDGAAAAQPVPLPEPLQALRTNSSRAGASLGTDDGPARA